MQVEIIIALISCLPLIITGIVVVLLSWKNRGRIESIETSHGKFQIQFNNGSRLRK